MHGPRSVYQVTVEEDIVGLYSEEKFLSDLPFEFVKEVYDC